MYRDSHSKNTPTRNQSFFSFFLNSFPMLNGRIFPILGILRLFFTALSVLFGFFSNDHIGALIDNAKSCVLVA